MLFCHQKAGGRAPATAAFRCHVQSARNVRIAHSRAERSHRAPGSRVRGCHALGLLRKEGHGRVRTHCHGPVVHCAADFGTGPGAHHQGGVFVADHRCVHGHDHLPVHTERRRWRAARRLVHHGAPNDGRANSRQRGAAVVPCASGSAYRGHRHGRRLPRLCGVGHHPCEERPCRLDPHGAARHHHLRGRLLQLPHCGRRHAPGDGQVPRQPREARLDHRLHGGPGLHYRAGILVGGGRGRLHGRGRLQHLRGLHPLQLLRAAHHLLRVLHAVPSEGLRPYGRGSGRCRGPHSGGGLGA